MFLKRSGINLLIRWAFSLFYSLGNMKGRDYRKGLLDYRYCWEGQRIAVHIPSFGPTSKPGLASLLARPGKAPV